MNSVGAHIVRPSPVLDSPSGLGTQREHRDAPLPVIGDPVGAAPCGGPPGQRLTSRLSVRPAR